jgi:Fic family protein
LISHEVWSAVVFTPARKKSCKIESLGRPAAAVLRVFQHAQTSPILSIGGAAEKTGVSFPTVASAVEHIQRLGLFREITGKQRQRLFVYEPYLAILNEGTEAPAG